MGNENRIILSYILIKEAYVERLMKHLNPTFGKNDTNTLLST